MATEAPPTLFEWAGGRDAFERLINAFYDRVERDELLAPLFGGKVSVEHRDHVIAWWSEVFGGPTRYTDELGGYDHMLAKHRGLAITPEQRFRFASLMSLAADDAGPPRRSGVPLGVRGLRRVGHPPGVPQLAAGRRGVRARPGPALGLGRGASVRRLSPPRVRSLVARRVPTFDEDTALTPAGDGRWAGEIADGWATPRGPLGGYVMALVLRAFELADR